MSIFNLFINKTIKYFRCLAIRNLKIFHLCEESLYRQETKCVKECNIIGFYCIKINILSFIVNILLYLLENEDFHVCESCEVKHCSHCLNNKTIC